MPPDYRAEPGWQDAHAQLLDDSGDSDTRMVRAVVAAVDLFHIERLRVVQGAVAEPGGEQRDLLGALLRGGDHAA